MSDPMERALRLLESCQLQGYADPEGHEIYPAIEDGVDSIANALAAAQVLATLAVAHELKTFNSDRSQWYREVLEVLSAAKDGDVSSLRSEQPAAAPGCSVCGKGAAPRECTQGNNLTEQQWNQHLNSWFRQFRREGNEKAESWSLALEEMEDRFGPCPDDPAAPSQQEGEDGCTRDRVG